MEASGIFAFYSLEGELRIRNPRRKFERADQGRLLESDRILYTRHLRVKIHAYIPDEKVPAEGFFLVDPRDGNAYLVDLSKDFVYKFGIGREKPYRLKGVSVRIETG